MSKSAASHTTLGPVPSRDAPEIRSVRDLRRAQIIRAARELVADGGLPALTFAALEERLSFTRGVITYHFRNRDEIVDAVLDSALEEIERARLISVAERLSSGEKVAAAIRATVRGFLDHPEASRVLLSFWARVPGDARATEVSARLTAQWRGQCARLLRRGQQDGAFDPEVAVEPMAALMVGVVIGIATQHVFEPGAIDAEAAIDVAVASVLARLER